MHIRGPNTSLKSSPSSFTFPKFLSLPPSFQTDSSSHNQCRPNFELNYFPSKLPLRRFQNQQRDHCCLWRYHFHSVWHGSSHRECNVRWEGIIVKARKFDPALREADANCFGIIRANSCFLKPRFLSRLCLMISADYTNSVTNWRSTPLSSLLFDCLLQSHVLYFLGRPAF